MRWHDRGGQGRGGQGNYLRGNRQQGQEGYHAGGQRGGGQGQRAGGQRRGGQQVGGQRGQGQQPWGQQGARGFQSGGNREHNDMRFQGLTAQQDLLGAFSLTGFEKKLEEAVTRAIVTAMTASMAQRGGPAAGAGGQTQA